MSQDWRWEPLHGESLAQAVSEEHYQLHLAAIEFDLRVALSIRSVDDIASRARWHPDFEPFEHQVRNLLTFCRRAPVALIADDVGLGKTISAGLILAELMARRKVRRTLLVCPKILLKQWAEELRTKFGIGVTCAVATELDAVDLSNVEVLATTYASAQSRMHRLADGSFDMIILDEAHKLRNLHGTSSPPLTARNIHDALARRAFRYALLLTATPVQNRLWDIYSLMSCLSAAKGTENPLGTRSAFASRFIGDDRGAARAVNPEAQAELRRILSDHMVRARRVDCRLPFPRRRVEVRRATPTPGEQELDRLMGQVLPSLHPFQQVSLGQALMSSPDALLAQLRKMSSEGSLPRSTFDDAARVARLVGESSKLRVLRELIGELRGQRDDWRVLVFTGRLATLTMIQRSLEAIGCRVGTVRGNDWDANNKAIADYRATPPLVNVIVSTDSGAEGVNLQAGNVVVNYDLPWNPMVVEQRIGRVQRLGSQFESVVVLNLVAAGSVEERVVQRLLEKLQVVEDTIGNIDGILESAGSGLRKEDGLEDSIRRLVVDALQGADPARNVEKIRDSIERAKAIYAAEIDAVDAQLGNLDRMHTSGPSLPELSPTSPRITPTDFARRALVADDVQLTPYGAGLFKAHRPGGNATLVAFSETTREPDRGADKVLVGGDRVERYVEGKPAFERLVGRWSARHSHRVRGSIEVDQTCIENGIRQWAAGSGDWTLENVELVDSSPRFSGEVVVRASASVDYDRYEKLLTSRMAGQERVDLDRVAGSTFLREAVDPLALDEAVETRVRDAVMSDSDIVAFCRFYADRCSEECAASSGDPERDALREQLTPRVAATVVAVQGVQYAVADVRARLRCPVGEEEEVRLQVVSSTGEVIDAPSLPTRTRDSSTSPECGSDAGCREPVEVSAAVEVDAVLQGVVAEVGEREAALGPAGISAPAAVVTLDEPPAVIVCELSGRTLAPSESVRSAVTGHWIALEAAFRSQLSGRFAEPEHAQRCAWTGRSGLSDIEVGQCSLLHVPIERSLLNDRGEFAVLRQVLDARAGGLGNQEYASWLRETFDVGSWKVDRVLTRPSSGRAVLVARAELRAFLRRERRYIGLLIEEGARRRVVANTDVGRVREGTWQVG